MPCSILYAQATRRAAGLIDQRTSGIKPAPGRRGHSGHRAVDPDRRRLRRVSADSEKEQVPGGLEKRGTRARDGWNVRDPAIGPALRLEHIDEAGAAACVNAPASGIHEYVVSIAADLALGDRSAGLHGENADPGGMPEGDDDLASGLVKRHRKVGASFCHPPDRRHAGGTALDDRDRPGIRQIDEYPFARILDLEALGMSLERNVADLGAARRIDQRQGAVSIAHEDEAGPGS